MNKVCTHTEKSYKIYCWVNTEYTKISHLLQLWMPQSPWNQGQGWWLDLGLSPKEVSWPSSLSCKYTHKKRKVTLPSRPPGSIHLMTRFPVWLCFHSTLKILVLVSRQKKKKKSNERSSVSSPQPMITQEEHCMYTELQTEELWALSGYKFHP